MEASCLNRNSDMNKGDLRAKIESCFKNNPTATYKEISVQSGASYVYVAKIGREMRLGKDVFKKDSQKVEKNINNRLVQKYVEEISDLLFLLPKEDRIKAIDRIIYATGLNIRDWVTVIPLPLKGKE